MILKNRKFFFLRRRAKCKDRLKGTTLLRLKVQAFNCFEMILQQEQSRGFNVKTTFS